MLLICGEFPVAAVYSNLTSYFQTFRCFNDAQRVVYCTRRELWKRYTGFLRSLEKYEQKFPSFSSLEKSGKIVWSASLGKENDFLDLIF